MPASSAQIGETDRERRMLSDAAAASPPLGLESPTPWQPAVVERVVIETDRARTFTLRLSQPRPFRAGQHYDVRLTAPDGYQAQRSYSIASAPGTAANLAPDTIDLTVELIPDGEVSPYFHHVVIPGDTLEVRGPVGGPFTWSAELGGPLLLVAGGSGIVPLRSMLAQRQLVAAPPAALLLYSARGLDEVIYRSWLDSAAAGADCLAVRYALTRRQPAGWKGYRRRVDPAMLEECVAQLRRLAGSDAATPLCYVCGPTGFVEAAADGLVQTGIAEKAIRTERFGPTG